MAVPVSIPILQTDAKPQGIARIIIASSVGTMIEWYDFYLFGSLTFVIAPYFFGTKDPGQSVLLWLATYATGFLVRPFGALVFGRVGDIVGRKYTFLVTMTIMGLSTAAIGLLPGLAQIGVLAPLLLVGLRLLEGLALGGEYGGAATYVAENSPANRRGFFTSFIQITATFGLFLSLIVILVTRNTLGSAAFADWGWRIPFFFSALLVVVSMYIRFSLRESPMYLKLKADGKTSKNPLRESFGNPYNRRMVLLALFGATAGQGAIWYTGQFYSSTFLQNVMKVDFNTANTIVAVALLLGTPLFVVMGALSDRIGRKPLIMAGCLIAAIAYLPIYTLMYSARPFLEPAKVLLAQAQIAAVPPDNPAYSPALLIALIFIQVVFVTMVYGPIAAFLVELFPTKIRYTSMSLPYHFGNGWFGGLIPVLATALATATGNLYAGLLFPITIGLMTFIVGSLWLRNTRNVDLASETPVGQALSSTVAA